jgi:hypothetical protein
MTQSDVQVVHFSWCLVVFVGFTQLFQSFYLDTAPNGLLQLSIPFLILLRKVIQAEINTLRGERSRKWFI